MTSDAILDKKNSEPSLMVITQNGYGKKTFLSQYRKTARGAAGVKNLNITTKTGKPVIVSIIHDDITNIMVTTKKGITIRLEPSVIPQLNRSTQGVKLIKLDTDDSVISCGIS